MSKKEPELNVLFVDDEADNLDAFVFNCEEFWNPRIMMNPHEIIRGGHDVTQYDAIIVDLVFIHPEDLVEGEPIDASGGMSILDWMQKNNPEIPTMVLSAFLTEDLREEIATNYPRVLCREKPLDFSKVEFRQMMRDFIANYNNGEPAPKEARA